MGLCNPARAYMIRLRSEDPEFADYLIQQKKGNAFKITFSLIILLTYVTYLFFVIAEEVFVDNSFLTYVSLSI
jgi:hypothetical protein